MYKHHTRILPFIRHRCSLAGRNVLVLSNIIIEDKQEEKTNQDRKKKKEKMLLVPKILNYIINFFNPIIILQILLRREAWHPS